MSDKLYDVLSKIQRWLPAVGVLYLALAQIWGLGYGDEINKTVIAIAAFLAATLEIANAEYNKAQKEDATAIESVEQQKG